MILKERTLKKKAEEPRVQNRIWMLIDRVSFKQIFFFWIASIFMLGVLYYATAGGESYLLQAQSKQRIDSLPDSIYFSFVTATTIGFGDIVPVGYFKLLAIAEVLIAVLLLALVTSKLVGIKQDVILNELYEISLNERMYRMRSSLLLFRQLLERLIGSIDDGTIKKRQLTNLSLQFSHMEETLREAIAVTTRSKGSHFLKPMDEVNAELILSSAINSLQKIEEFARHADNRKLDWKSDCNVAAVKDSIEMTGKLLKSIELEHEAVARDLKQWFNEVVSSLEKRIPEGRSRRKLRC